MPSRRNTKTFPINLSSASIATTGNTEVEFIAGRGGRLIEAMFSAVEALAGNDTNFITFSITNLGQAGAGSTAMLAATDPNTTKATGGTALAARTKRLMTLNATAANLVVTEGDRIRVRAAVTGTLGAVETLPLYCLLFETNGTGT